jgi:autophagy-related protein 9
MVLLVTSPLLTPGYLAFEVYPEAQNIVRFLSENTVYIDGVGDVCSMAVFDLEKHGNPLWQVPGQEVTKEQLHGRGDRSWSHGVRYKQRHSLEMVHRR